MTGSPSGQSVEREWDAAPGTVAMSDAWKALGVGVALLAAAYTPLTAALSRSMTRRDEDHAATVALFWFFRIGFTIMALFCFGIAVYVFTTN